MTILCGSGAATGGSNHAGDYNTDSFMAVAHAGYWLGNALERRFFRSRSLKWLSLMSSEVRFFRSFSGDRSPTCVKLR